MRTRLRSAALAAAVLLVLWGAHRPARRWWLNFRTYSLPSPRLYDLLSELALSGLYRRIVREALDVRPDASVLDVGCGPGALPVLLGAAAPRLKLTGLDLSPDMIALGRRRAREAGVEARVTFRVGDVARLPFADAHFDLVLSSLSRHHWADPIAGLREIRRVLKPGGEARIYDVADWFARIESQAPGFDRLIAAGAFEEARLEPFWSVGPLTVLYRLTLR